MTAMIQPMGRRERNRAMKIQRILDTAKAVVEEGGIEALTIQRLAQNLDSAVGALYRYFPSKDALLAELQCSVIRDCRDVLFAQLDAMENKAPLFQLVALAKCYQRYLLDHPGHFRLISLGVSDPKQYLPDELGLKVMQEVQTILMRVSLVLTRAAIDDVLIQGDIRDRTLVYWSAIQGVMQMNKLSRFAPDTLDNNRLLKETLSTLLVGWGATHERVVDTLTQVAESTP